MRGAGNAVRLSTYTSNGVTGNRHGGERIFCVAYRPENTLFRHGTGWSNDDSVVRNRAHVGAVVPWLCPPDGGLQFYSRCGDPADGASRDALSSLSISRTQRRGQRRSQTAGRGDVLVRWRSDSMVAWRREAVCKRELGGARRRTQAVQSGKEFGLLP